MESYSAVEDLLLWAQLLNHLKAMTTETITEMIAVRAVNDLLIALYLICYYFNRKAVFIMAFLFACVYGSVGYDLLDKNAINFHLGYAVVYAYLTMHLIISNINCLYLKRKEKYNLSTICFCVIMILFDIGMATDAYLFPNAETFIYTNHGHFIMGIHLLIILSLVEWRTLKKLLVNFFHHIVNSFYRSIAIHRYLLYFS